MLSVTQQKNLKNLRGDLMEIYLAIPVLPLLASIASFTENKRLTTVFSLGSAFLTLILSFATLFVNPAANEFLLIDGFSKIMLLTISSIYTTTLLFSLTYLRHVKKPLLSMCHYMLFENLFASSMLFSVSINNLGLLWVGIEATTITSALLVAIDNDEASLESAWRYIIIVSVGLIMSLTGIILIYAGAGTLQITKLTAMVTPKNPKLLIIGAALSTAGFLTKAGIFPMHTWLPDVHGRSVAPVSAIFSGVLLPTALFGTFRVLQVAHNHRLLLFTTFLGFLSVIFAAIFLMAQRFYKRMFAYSSIENMGMILIGLSLFTPTSILGGVILLISHAFAKSSAFYSTGNILSVYKSRNINEIRDLNTRMPYTAYNLLFSSLAVTGAPPFATFLGEFLIIISFYRHMGLVATAILILFLALAFLSINFRILKMSFDGGGAQHQKQKAEVMSSFVPILNTLISFLIVFASGTIEKILLSGMIR